MHRRFSSNRLLGEWFEASDDLIAFVATLKPESDGSFPRVNLPKFRRKAPPGKEELWDALDACYLAIQPLKLIPELRDQIEPWLTDKYCDMYWLDQAGKTAEATAFVKTIPDLFFAEHSQSLAALSHAISAAAGRAE